MNNKVQTNDHKLALELQNLKMLVIENVVDVYINILGCSPTRNIVFIEFKIV